MLRRREASGPLHSPKQAAPREVVVEVSRESDCQELFLLDALSAMAMLRLLALAACAACAAGFMPAVSPVSVQTLGSQRGCAVVMRTAATKPQRVNTRNREYNKMYRSEMRTRIKRVRLCPPPAAPGARRPRAGRKTCTPVQCWHCLRTHIACRFFRATL